MLAVSDTSPLVLLDKAGHLWILGKIFEKVFIPPAVDAEWLRPGG
jgi:predicted nucleic acid-binding protein